MWKPMHLCVLNWVLWYFSWISLATKHILIVKRQNKDTYRFLLIIIIVEIANTSQPLQSVSIYFLQDVVNYKKIDVTGTRYLSNICS